MNNHVTHFSDLTLADQKLLPSPFELEKFNMLGWYTSPKMLPDELIEAAILGSHAFYAGERDFELPSKLGIADDSNTAQNVLSNNEFVTLQKQELRDLGFYKLIVATAAILSGTKAVRLFADSLINKQPQTHNDRGIVGWHTDKAYWPTCTSNNMLTAWIPLQDVTIDMGPVVYLNSSHHWVDQQELKQFYSFNNQNLSGLSEYLKSVEIPIIESPMTVKRGQVCFHNCNVIHASKPNTSGKPRLALAIHFQDQANCYQRCLDENGNAISIGYDKICSHDKNGLPDYNDPSVFPVVYSE